MKKPSPSKSTTHPAPVAKFRRNERDSRASSVTAGMAGRPSVASVAASAEGRSVDNHAILFNGLNICRHECFDQDGLPVTLEWRCAPVIFSTNQPPPTHTYQLTIFRDVQTDDSRPYSLYNMAAQGRRWNTRIKTVTGINVRVFKQKRQGNGYVFEALQLASGDYYATGASVVVDCDLRRMHPRNGAFSEANVLFLQFDGASCTLVIESSRPLSERRRLNPKTYGSIYARSEHDAVPPPPEPGGEDGDEE
jgi:hypothetical protein